MPQDRYHVLSSPSREDLLYLLEGDQHTLSPYGLVDTSPVPDLLGTDSDATGFKDPEKVEQ